MSAGGPGLAPTGAIAATGPYRPGTRHVWARCTRRAGRRRDAPVRLAQQQASAGQPKGTAATAGRREDQDHGLDGHQRDRLRLRLRGTLLGMLLHSRLPEEHLSTESKDVVKLAMGVVATMTALVLGMLVASAKASFDAQHQLGVAQLAANVIVLDRFLAYYGEEARPTRELLREPRWPTCSGGPGLRTTQGGSGVRGPGARTQEPLKRAVRTDPGRLRPTTDAQHPLQAQTGLKIVGDTGQMRWFLFAPGRGTHDPEPRCW